MKNVRKKRLLIKLCVQLCLLCHLMPSVEPFCLLRTPLKFVNFRDNERVVQDIFLKIEPVCPVRMLHFLIPPLYPHLATVNTPGAST